MERSSRYSEYCHFSPLATKSHWKYLEDLRDISRYFFLFRWQRNQFRSTLKTVETHRSTFFNSVGYAPQVTRRPLLGRFGFVANFLKNSREAQRIVSPLWIYSYYLSECTLACWQLVSTDCTVCEEEPDHHREEEESSSSLFSTVLSVRVRVVRNSYTVLTDNSTRTHPYVLRGYTCICQVRQWHAQIHAQAVFNAKDS